MYDNCVGLFQRGVLFSLYMYIDINRVDKIMENGYPCNGR